MDLTVIVGGLITAIVSMAGLFVYLLKDERARNDRLVLRVDEVTKLYLSALTILDKSVDAVENKEKLLDAIGTLRDAKETKDTLASNLMKLFEALAELRTARERYQADTGPTPIKRTRQGGQGGQS